MDSMRKFVLGLALIGLIGGVGACGSDDDPTDPPVEPPINNPPTIEMTAPAGGDAVLPATVLTIEWIADDDNAVTGVDLSYTADGVTETAIAADQTGGTYAWTTPTETLYGVVVKGVAKDADGLTGEDETADIFAIIQFSARGYVQGQACEDCHATTYDEVVNKSGHPYKLNKVVGGVPPTYPNSVVPNPPAGFTWADVAYVIGGYGWKARFIGLDGYIITPAAGLNQWNLETEGWVDYHAGELKPYDCGPCHMTGWQTLAENGDVHQDGLIGIEGTWEQPGVWCEECHGPGADHVSTQSSADITVDETSEMCGNCHQRDGMTTPPPASGGFIKHHEQYNEWNMSAHSTATGGPGCNTCHDPHLGTSYGNGGVVTECETCHAGKTNAHLVPIEKCETCHMAEASKSAVASSPFNGDVTTHIFKINSNPLGKDVFFADDGATVRAPTAGVTLDFVCYTCHTDPITGEGGGMSEKTLTELSIKATGIHN